MTCIIGLAHESGEVFIGADSAGFDGDGWEIQPQALPKVFGIGEFLLGYTTSFRMGQLLQYSLDLPPHDETLTDLEYMVRHFIEAVRSCLKGGGFAKIEDNQEEGGTFLVGYRGRLYTVQSDFSVLVPRDGLDACGCGRRYALGAMAVMTCPPAERIMYALEVAARFSGGVTGPFHVRSKGRH